MQTSTPMPERTVPASLNVESTLSNQPLNRYQTTALEAVPGALQLGKGGKIQCNVCPSAEVLLSCITGREADDPLLCQLLGLLARNIASHPECLQAVDAGSGCRPGQKASIAGWWHRG
jgi:antitoxin PrlF